MRAPCDEAHVRSRSEAIPCTAAAQPWILAATILGSSMAFIDGTVVNVALPVLQTTFHATVVDVQWVDRKSTRLNSSHANISYAVFCLKKKNSSVQWLYYATHTS